MTTNPAELGVERRGPVLWLTIQREERRNAMNHGVLAAMGQAIAEAQADRELRAIVITGAGDKAFCAGADLQNAQATSDYSEPTAIWRACCACPRQPPAADRACQRRVHGGRHGAAGDVRPGGGGAPRRLRPAGGQGRRVPAQVLTVLQHLVPRRQLAELCLTGEPSPAKRPWRGLVNHVADDWTASSTGC